MKKALLIATTFTLMALSLPAHATQINQADEDGQAKMSQQAEKIQTTTSLCRLVNGKKVCY